MVSHRLRRLMGNRPYFALLALDHGLTYGRSSESVQLPVDGVLEACSGHIGGFVATYGVARTIKELPCNISLVLQCFGGPEHQPRNQIATIEDAIRLDAAAVSIQLKWDIKDISDRIEIICRFTSDSHALGFPVLFMINGIYQSSDLPQMIRMVQEMGADIVKINCAGDRFDNANDDVINCLKEGPPVLMAGGPIAIDLTTMATNAANIGLSGYCVGRHIFHSHSPQSIVSVLNSIFSKTTQLNLESA